ncbi:uncharacterized protein G2W53_033753 [Senna tora]|uniref:Uncharacterized protein n=1 Tax=Senna tora TaxID=362788 RepID=A0A834T2S9_9FABA|nr:uncharacterized protein G2W53_033753 [Senna tora]
MVIVPDLDLNAEMHYASKDRNPKPLVYHGNRLRREPGIGAAREATDCNPSNEKNGSVKNQGGDSQPILQDKAKMPKTKAKKADAGRQGIKKMEQNSQNNQEIRKHVKSHFDRAHDHAVVTKGIANKRKFI